jgi:hypothetical protein
MVRVNGGQDLRGRVSVQLKEPIAPIIYKILPLYIIPNKSCEIRMTSKGLWRSLEESRKERGKGEPVFTILETELSTKIVLKEE